MSGGFNRKITALFALLLALLVVSPAVAAEGETPSKSSRQASRVVDRTEAARSPSSRTQTVDLNGASVDELCELPGIGPKKAAAIVEQRQRRRFTRVSQLLLVRGIGRKTLAKLRPLVKVGPPPRMPARKAVRKPARTAAKTAAKKPARTPAKKGASSTPR
jgi:competence protein ComEA